MLLVREKEDDYWTLPGGWADIGESSIVGIVREVREESGYDVQVIRPIALYDRIY
ncbi:MAG: NUDIX domain-containing protein [Chamaesiphon sp.]|nr:NUDIX domain-containing protein [Chamaesiphon sp.]